MNYSIMFTILGLTIIADTSSSEVVADSSTSEEVRVYNWFDYIEENLLRKFEGETGLKLIYDVFDSNEVSELKMLTGGSGYDVVVSSGIFLNRQILTGAIQKLEMSNLPNHDNMWHAIEAHTRQYDPNNAYSINYMWGTIGIGVNVVKVQDALGKDAPLNSLELVFSPSNMEKLAECGVYFPDSPKEMISSVLQFLGEDPDSHDPEVIAKAEPVLMAIRPYVRKFHNSEYINALAKGEICVAIGWSWGVLQAQDYASHTQTGVEIAYNVAK